MTSKEQGLSNDRYMLIPRTLIFIRNGNSFLLLRGADTKRIWANKFNGIGGHVERSEDILSSARRELLEETGLSTDIALCGVVTVDVEDQTGVGIYVFTGEYAGGQLSSNHEGSLEWIKMDELDSLPSVGDVKIFLDRIAKMTPGDSPFSAHSYYNDQNILTVRFNG
jgi:8-oxo-dGTP diphosphatase